MRLDCDLTVQMRASVLQSTKDVPTWHQIKRRVRRRSGLAICLQSAAETPIDFMAGSHTTSFPPGFDNHMA